MSLPRILSSKPLVKAWGSLTEYVLEYRKANGDIAHINREVYDRGHAAAVLLHNLERDTVVLVKQLRPPPLINGADPYLLEACAGALDGDTPEGCVRREAIEEAGIVVQDLTRVCAAYGNAAAMTEIVTLFIGSFTDEGRTAGGGLAQEGEDIEVVELPFVRAFELIASGGIVDMKTIILLQAMMIERHVPIG